MKIRGRAMDLGRLKLRRANLLLHRLRSVVLRARVAESFPHPLLWVKVKFRGVEVLPHLELGPREAEVLPRPLVRTKAEPRRAGLVPAPGVKLLFMVHRLRHLVSISLKIHVHLSAKILWVIHFRIRRREGL